MSQLTTIPPARRPELSMTPLGERGRYVVKDPQTREYYTLGEQEYFLLERLDGKQTSQSICASFQKRFGEPLSEDEFQEFIELTKARGFLQAPGAGVQAVDAGHPKPEARSRKPVARPRQSVLYWRKSFFDPDRLFTWLEPRVRFFWTRTFLVLSAVCILFAATLVWANRLELVSYFAHALRWETLLLVWLTLIVVTTCHEFAHGLTCKRYGGEVHEIGFLLMFLMPCFYCNVSDAWLFREKSKRLWVTFAGGYFELFLWAMAVFTWRLTLQDSLLNYLAWIVLSVTGFRWFFNFNPLLKLDGYYLLSDWVEIPNLRQRSLNRSKAHFRHLFWGGPKPDPEQRSRFLTSFGLICWGFSTIFLVGILFGMSIWFHGFLGTAGYALVAALAVPALTGIFQGTSAGEFTKMIKKRFLRTAVWLGILGGIVAALYYVEVDEYSSGTFTVRPAAREEVRGPVAGYLKTVYVDEGDHVSPGDVIARLEIRDLDSRIEQKQAELKESAAQLALLKAGTRPEKIADQKQRITRAERWHAIAKTDLARMQRTLAAELKALAEVIGAAEARRVAAVADWKRKQTAFEKGGVTQSEIDKAGETLKLAVAKLAQGKAELEARRAKGTLLAEQELAKRAKDLTVERAALTLLQAGSRPQQIAAQQARIDRLQAELRHLHQQQDRLEIRSSIAGVVVTPRLREKIGQYVREGDLICVVEDRSHYEAEITLTEQKLQRIGVDLPVELKARALPYDQLTGRVIGIAESAENEDQAQSTIKVRCRLNETPATLRTAMTGHARIYTGRKSVGEILLDRSLRLLRTEFWW